MNLLAGHFIVVQSKTKSIFTMIELLNDLPEVEYAEPNYTNQTSNSRTEHTEKPWEKFVVKEAAIEVIDSQIDLRIPQIKPDIKVNRKKIPPVQSDYVEEIKLKDLLFISDKVPVNLAEAVEAIDYAIKKEVNIISNSWVRDGFSKGLDEAIHVADKKGISFVAAASIAATIGTSVSALAYNPSYANHNLSQRDLISTVSERRPASHVSAGVLSLYIAQEGSVEKTGRARLIAKNAPSKEETFSAWSINSQSIRSPATTNIKISQDYSFPGAKFIKLEIEKLDSDTNIDLIVLRNANGVIVGNISGSGKYYETDYIETNLITVEFTSDATSTSIGSVIRNVKVIY